jgi:hypothetical protein
MLSQKEMLTNEIKNLVFLDEDWDGEGALKPIRQSIREAIHFVSLLDEKIILPELMLLCSGHISLFWNENNLYADIQFLGNGSIAYFIKKNEDTYKNVIEFKLQEIPNIILHLIQ